MLDFNKFNINKRSEREYCLAWQLSDGVMVCHWWKWNDQVNHPYTRYLNSNPAGGLQTSTVRTPARISLINREIAFLWRPGPGDRFAPTHRSLLCVRVHNATKSWQMSFNQSSSSTYIKQQLTDLIDIDMVILERSVAVYCWRWPSWSQHLYGIRNLLLDQLTNNPHLRYSSIQ